MSGTNLQYGVYAFENCLTVQFHEEAKYDPSGTDVWYHEYTITVSTIVMGNNLGASIGATLTAGSSAAEVKRALGTYLLHPRRAFRMSINGDTILETSTVDANNGPHPVSLEVTRIAPAAFNVNYTIRVAVIQCASGGIDPISGEPFVDAEANPGVVSHKWNYEETVDDCWYRKRTWNGVIRVSSIATPPDLFRRLVVPPLAAGYKRESQRFAMEPNGLNGSYTITDVSVDAAAPFPALDWGGTHSRSLGIDGVKQLASYHVWMKGAPGADKVQLLARCLQAARGRLGTIGDKFKLTDGSGVTAKITNVSMSHAENDSRVELRMTALVVATDKDPTALGLHMKRFGEDFSQFPGYNRQVSVQLNPYDPTLPVGAFVSYLQSPCGGPKGMPQPLSSAAPPEGDLPPQREPQGDTRDQPEPSAQYDIVPEVQDDPEPLKISQAQEGGEYYDGYVVTTQYKREGGKVAIPVFNPLEDGSEIVTVQRRPPMTVRIVEITAERNNAPPELPDFEDIADSSGDGGAVLLRSNVSPISPQLEPDGRTVLYSMKARYEYAMKKSITADTELRLGRAPFLAEEGVASRYKLSDHTNNEIIEA